MRNMQDELSGPMEIEFIGGTRAEANIDTVVVDAKGHPILLMEDEGEIYNWGTIARVKRR